MGIINGNRAVVMIATAITIKIAFIYAYNMASVIGSLKKEHQLKVFNIERYKVKPSPSCSTASCSILLGQKIHS